MPSKLEFLSEIFLKQQIYELFYLLQLKMTHTECFPGFKKAMKAKTRLNLGDLLGIDYMKQSPVHFTSMFVTFKASIDLIEQDFQFTMAQARNQ